MFDFIFAFFALVCFGFSNIFTKKVLTQFGVYTSLLWKYIFSIIFTLSAVLFFSHIQIPSFNLLGPLILDIVIGAIAVIAFYKAMDQGQMSIITPLTNSYVLLTAVIGIVFFQELISPIRWVGGILILICVLIIATQKFDLKNLEQGVPYALITIVGWGLYYSLLKVLSLELDAFNVLFYTEAGIFLLVVAYIGLTKKPIVRPTSSFHLLALVPLLSAMGGIAYVLSIQTIGIGLSAFIISSNPGFGVLLARIILHERLPSYKYLALIGVIVGLALVSLL